MNVQTFFDTILPTVGLRCLALPRPEGKWWHKFGQDNAWLMGQVAALDARQETIYFACASYQMLAPGQRPRRNREHVLAVKAFWTDLDVGDDPKKYASQAEAAAAILAFAKKLTLPMPWIVSTGTGLHVYMPLDVDCTDIEAWKAIAAAFKRALRAEGVKFDPTRTADLASLLRPPGSTHRKAAPKPVRILREGKRTLTLADMFQKVLPWYEAPQAAVSSKVSGPATAAFGGGMGYDPSSAHMIADRCAVIGEMRDTLGSRQDEPEWYACLGVLAQTEEAAEVGQLWSSEGKGYEPRATAEKMAQTEAYPTTCTRMNDLRPDLCQTCPHWGRIPSPIVLGRGPPQDPQQAEAEEEAAAGGGGSGRGAFGGGTTTGGPDSGSPKNNDWPEGFGFRKADRGTHLVLTHFVPADGDKPASWDVFCDTYFRPVMRYELNTDHHNRWVKRDHGDVETMFDLDGSTIGKGGKDLYGELGLKGILTITGKERIMDIYMRRWMDKLRTTPLVVAHTSFGWSNGHFVTGDVSIAYDGSETPALMGPDTPARQKQDAIRCSGDLDTWVGLVDRAYNAPGQQAFQFQLLCGFAAPLLSLLQSEVKGVTVYAHSSGSGVGKTTVQRVALSIWGDWKKMMMVQNRATANALIGLLGAYNTLPVVYDELTNAKNDEASDLVFAVSQGVPKERMNQAGELRANNSGWSTILLASGNTLLSDKIASNRTNTDAELSRLFEFTQPATAHLDVKEANALFPLIDENYGHAGLLYARYLVAHRDKITRMLKAMRDKVIDDFAIQQADRYWSVLYACVLVSLYLCRGLKLLAFDDAALKEWMADQLDDNRVQKSAAILTEEDKLGLMVSALMANTLVTEGSGSKAKKAYAVIAHEPRGEIVGRSVVPTVVDPTNGLWLSRAAIREWCVKHGANYREMYEAAKANGWAADDDAARINLALGTTLDSGTYVRCWTLFPDRMPMAVAQPHLSLVGKP